MCDRPRLGDRHSRRHYCERSTTREGISTSDPAPDHPAPARNGRRGRKVFDQSHRPWRRTDRTSRCTATCHCPGVGDVEPAAPRSFKKRRSLDPGFAREGTKEIRSEGRQKAVPVLETLIAKSRHHKKGRLLAFPFFMSAAISYRRRYIEAILRRMKKSVARTQPGESASRRARVGRVNILAFASSEGCS